LLFPEKQSLGEGFLKKGSLERELSSECETEGVF